MSASRLSKVNETVLQLEKRLAALERVNQTLILAFGNIRLDGNTGTITIGANGEIVINGQTGIMTIGVNDDIVIDGSTGIITVGADGEIKLDSSTGILSVGETDEIRLDGNTGIITAGPNDDIKINGSTGIVYVGANDEIVIDGPNKRIVMEDSAGTNRILLDSAGGVIKVSQPTTNVLTATNSQLTFLSTYRQLREVNIAIHGGNTFTNVAPYVAIDDWEKNIDFSDWEDMEWYFECTLKAGTGDAKVELYNLTDGASVTGSRVETTSTDYVSVRSSSITKLTGVKAFVVRYGHDPSGGGSDFINLTIADIIFRRPA